MARGRGRGQGLPEGRGPGTGPPGGRGSGRGGRGYTPQDPFYLNAAQILQLHHWHPAANNLQPIQGNLVFNYPTQGAAPPSFAPIFSGPLVHLDPAPMARAPMHPAQMEAAPHRFCMEPAPLEPMPLEPAPLELAPLEPAPLEPAPLEPTPLKPAPLEPASVEPEVSATASYAAGLNALDLARDVQVPVLIKEIRTVEGANEAMAYLETRHQIAVGCEGDLANAGQRCLIQVYAAPICFIFDLVTNDSATKAALIRVIKSVLENGAKLKLIHDCRRPAAALRYQLHINLSNVFDTQVAHGLQQHMDTITGGNPQAGGDATWANLADLLQAYELHVPPDLEMMHPELKHWQKRPLHSHLMDFAACKVVNVWGLAETVMKEVGDAGLAGTIRLCKQVMQQHFQDADKMPADEEARHFAILTLADYCGQAR